MTTIPTPRLFKGALVAIDRDNPLASLIVFQYNPDTLTRRLEARAAGEGGDKREVLRLMGPPKETITLSVEIDADDQPRNPLPDQGIYPTLSALEMMLYPKSRAVLESLAMARAGMIEIVPPEAPLTLFVWGPKRVLPVRLTGFSITEEMHDPRLNPIRAKVELSLQVLSYADFQVTDAGHTIFLAHQIAKEALAVAGAVTSAQNLGATW